MRLKRFVSFQLLVLVGGSMFWLLSCDGTNPPTGESVIFPAPSDPSPANYSTDQNIMVNLCWSECSIDDATMQYLVSMGTDDEPLHFIALTHNNNFAPAPLEPNTRYYWRIEARNESGLTRKSPVWSFTTGNRWMYPLLMGAEWEYEFRVEYENFQPESLAHVIDQPPIDTLSVYIMGVEVVPNGNNVWALVQYSSFYDESSISYFENRPDGLYYLGTEGYAIQAIPHKPIADGGSKVAAEMPRSTACLIDLLVADNAASLPQRSLAYPLEVGARWKVIDADGSDAGWTIAKEVDAKHPIATNYGYIDAYRISRYWDKDGDGDWDDDIDWVDYVGREGLLGRAAIYHDIAVVDYTTPDPTTAGTFDIRERLRLIYCNLIGEVY